MFSLSAAGSQVRKNTPVFTELSVKSLIRITVNKYHVLALNGPKYIVRFMYLSGLGDPNNENLFNTFS